jgi:hypothetical protein
VEDIMRHNKIDCPKCKKAFGSNNINKHIPKCEGIKKCPICEKEYVGNTKTCSYSCSNKMFRSGEDNGNWKQDAYQSTCFLYHKKECVVCGENKIVEVHHMNENHNDNSPANLVPLCPTHHQYFHSRYRNEVEYIIQEYLEKWKIKV